MISSCIKFIQYPLLESVICANRIVHKSDDTSANERVISLGNQYSPSSSSRFSMVLIKSIYYSVSESLRSISQEKPNLFMGWCVID